MTYGLITLIFTYLTALELFNCQFTIHNSQFPILLPTSYFLLPTPQLFATFVVLFVACQPMFAFITASVANEPANIAFCAIGLWLAQRYVLYGPSPHWGQAVALGVTLGLISLSKMTGLSFGWWRDHMKVLWLPSNLAQPAALATAVIGLLFSWQWAADGAHYR
jgi:hypothetical protein